MAGLATHNHHPRSSEAAVLTLIRTLTKEGTTMKTALKIIGFICICLAALPTAGMLYAVGTAPASAEGNKPRVDYAAIATNPITTEMQNKLATDVINFFACSPGVPRDNSTNGTFKLEQANKAAIAAVPARDLSLWNTEAGTVRSEIKRIGAIYCKTS